MALLAGIAISASAATAQSSLTTLGNGISSSRGSDRLLVGCSPSGPSQAPRATDISASMGYGWTMYGDSPLAHGTTTAPIFGRSIEFVTSGMHAANAFGAVVVALNAYPRP